MTGWKTKLGGAGMILSGLGMLIGGYVANPINGEMMAEGVTLISAGLAAIGIGHKIEKAKK